ncbi:MAG: thiamine-phosphate diphosphorylase [Spirochaetes bacterium RBG_13_51_14]|nr:MAG: thiamine-phosphate diphosphorylase [Spirochaetes bacterium RBG_13_51_14]
MKGYYFITDEDLSAAGILSDAETAAAAGVDVIQYRNKTAETRRIYDEARLIKKICGSGRCRFIINDRVDIALAVDADGVHIGQEDMPFEVARRLLGKEKIIGVTVHTVEEAVEAEGSGADYLGVSPIFSTGTKSDAGAPCGVDTLAAIRRACGIPLVAIGGIDLSNADECIRAGADMVCAISAVVARPDVAAEIKNFQRKFGL